MRILSLITALATACGLFAASANAQQGSQAAAPAAPKAMPVLVVDLGHVLKNHPTMKAEIEKIEVSMGAVDEEFKAKRDKILADMKALGEQFTEGTPDYIRQEKMIAEADTQFRLELVRKRKEFDEKRAIVLTQVHAQVTHVLKFACGHLQAGVVLRVSREKLDPKKPQTIEIGMGQEVFYFDPNTDITDWVLQQLQASAPAAAAAAPTATATRPAPGGPPVQR